MSIQRRLLYDAARPEIVLDGWSRYRRAAGDSTHEIVVFSKVRNIGKGPALNLHMNCHLEREGRPVAGMSTVWLPILAAGDAHEADNEIVLWWENAAADPGGLKGMVIQITAYCWDSRNIRHETTYSLWAVQDTTKQIVANAVAPGVMLAERRTTSRPVWLLKLIRLGLRKLTLPAAPAWWRHIVAFAQRDVRFPRKRGESPKPVARTPGEQ